MRLTNNLQEDKLDSRNLALLAAKNSPNLNDLIEVKVDKNTKLYFKKGTTSEKIEERVNIYRKKLLSVSIELNRKEEVLLPYIKKTVEVDG